MSDHQRLLSALQRDFAAIDRSSDRAWSRAAALRVIDCVLSLNRHYDRFVVPRLDAFEKRFPRIITLRQLRELIDSFSSPTEFVKDTLNYRDGPRARVLSGVTDFLVAKAEGAVGSAELARLESWAQDARPEDYRRLGIRGFGLAGFQYLRMLFGGNTTKPDVHILRYVTRAVGHPVTDLAALALLEEVAKSGDLLLRDIDTTIWEHSARQ